MNQTEQVLTRGLRDRRGWPPGPWDAEPEDRAEWRIGRFAALLLRNDEGAWCGYLGIPPVHPWYAVSYHDIPAHDVHGGLSFSGFCDDREGAARICHVAAPGEPERVWWLGFDTAHAYDLAPISSWPAEIPRPAGDVYRDRPYCADELLALAGRAEAAG